MYMGFKDIDAASLSMIFRLQMLEQLQYFIVLPFITVIPFSIINRISYNLISSFLLHNITLKVNRISILKCIIYIKHC